MNIKIILAEHEVFETERLILRKVELADAEDMFEYGQDEETTEYVFPRKKSLEDTKEGIVDYFIPKRLETWAIVEKTSGKMLGTIDLRVQNDQGDFGWVLNRKFWGRGYAPEAAACLRDFAFNELKLSVLTATCDSENSRSSHVMKKLGMKKLGQTWIYREKLGRSTPHDYCALTREEFLDDKAHD
ncbi:GNAT family N-acetyltransferase [Lactovum odontotermitis]